MTLLFESTISLLNMNLFFKKIIQSSTCSLYRLQLKQTVRIFSTNKAQRSLKGVFRLGLAGLTVGALVGTGYSIHLMNQPRAHIINEEVLIPIIKDVPYTKPTRIVKVIGDESGLNLTLYQYQTCPFCCKVRAFLDYYGISYNIVEVDPVLRQSIKWSPYRKVPILVAKTDAGYQPLNDSTMIISALASYLSDKRKNLPEIVQCFPSISFIDEDGTKKNEIMNKYFLMLDNRVELSKTVEELQSNERKWRKWADNVLVHTLSPNVYRTWDEALQAFNWFSDVGEWDVNFPAWERYLMIYVGAGAMWLIGKRLKKRHNLKDDVRQSLYDECNYWVRAVRSKGKFMGGDKPNLADLAVYGVLSSIEGCDAFKDLLNSTKIKEWFYNVKEAIHQHEGAKYIM